MINFSENIDLLRQLLFAENARNKLSDLQLTVSAAAKLRDENYNKRVFWLCVLEGFVPSSTSFDDFQDLQNSQNRESQNRESQNRETQNRESQSLQRQLLTNIKRVRELVYITSGLGKIAAGGAGVSLSKNVANASRNFGSSSKNVANASRNFGNSPENFAQPAQTQILTYQLIDYIAKTSSSTTFRDSSTFAVISTVNQFPYNNGGYVPPKSRDVKGLLEELCDYVNLSRAHPIVKASTTLYQILSIWPFTRYNVTIAHLLADLVLSKSGFDFNQIGSTEKFFAENRQNFYSSCLTMDLPNFYYSGRDNPPNPEIWHSFFFEVVNSASKTALEQAKFAATKQETQQAANLNTSEAKLVKFLRKTNAITARPVDIARYFNVTNKTATNWLRKLSALGIVRPNENQQRTTEYSVLIK